MLKSIQLLQKLNLALLFTPTKVLNTTEIDVSKTSVLILSQSGKALFSKVFENTPDFSNTVSKEVKKFIDLYLNQNFQEEEAVESELIGGVVTISVNGGKESKIFDLSDMRDGFSISLIPSSDLNKEQIATFIDKNSNQYKLTLRRKYGSSIFADGEIFPKESISFS